MRHVNLAVRICRTSVSESSVGRVGRAHTRIRAHARSRASREAAAGSTVGLAEGGGLRLSDAQSHLALALKDGAGRRGALSRG